MKRKLGISSFLVVEILLVVVFSLLNLAVVVVEGHWATQSLVAHDNATFLVTAISHNKDLGVPYKDYWEYRPPGFFFLLDFWSKFFGTHILPFKLLETGTRFLIGLQIVFLARKIFSPFQAFTVSFLTIAIFFSPVFGQGLYPEAYGILPSLAGLLCLVYIKKIGLRFFLATLLFSLSIQIKDTFGGATLAILPPLFYLLLDRDYRSFFKGSIFSILGFSVPLLSLWFYLANLNALDAYFEVLQFKSSLNLSNSSNLFSLLHRYDVFFRESRVFLFHDYSLAILAIGSLFVLFALFKRKISTWLSVKKNTLILRIPISVLSINSQKLNLATVLFYSLGSFVGPSLVYAFSPHYLFSVVIPACFFWAIVALFFENVARSLFKSFKRNLIFLSSLFLLLFPNGWITIQYQGIPSDVLQQAYKNLAVPDADISVEKYINLKTKTGDCVLGLYGWKSSEVYLYSERKPCTRFIIPNIVIAQWQKQEYRNAILNNPPQAVVYSDWGADMDWLLFEREVIDITQILKNCYKQDSTYTHGRWPLELYFPVYSGEKLKTCVKNNAGG